MSGPNPYTRERHARYKQKTWVVSCRFDNAVADEIGRYARRHGMNVSQAIRKIVAIGLRREERRT